MKTAYLIKRASFPRLPSRLLMGVLLATCSEGIWASTITETVPFTIAAPSASNFPPQTVTVSTPQFDPALGMLESAATTITGTVSSDLEFFSTGTGGSFDITLTDALNLAIFGQELSGSVPANQAVFDFPLTIALGPLDKSDPPEAVLGTGTWDQLFGLPYPSLDGKQSPATVLVPGLAITGTSVTTYTYTPAIADVPEPRFVLFPGLLLAAIFATLTKHWKNDAQA